MPEQRRSLEISTAVAVAVAALLGLLLVFASRFVLLELNVRRLGLSALAATATACAATGAGAAAIALFERLVSGRHERRPVGVETALLCGVPVYGAIVFLIALASAGPQAMLLPMLLGLTGLAWTHADISFASFRRGPGDVPAWAAFALALCILAAIVLAQLPAVGLDDVAYHLTIPKQWALEGRAVALPLMSHSWFPLGSESADLPLFALLGSDDAVYASHLLRLLVSIGTGALLLSWLRSSAPSLGVAAASAIASTPALLLTAGWSGNDMLLLGLALLLARALDDTGPESQGGIVAATVCGGLLVKYTFVPLGGAMLAASIVTRPDARRLLARAATAGAAAGCVFFLRNLVLTGNPFAPFFSGEGGAVSGFRAGEPIAATLASYVFDGRLIDDTLGVGLLGLALAFPVAAVVHAEGRRLRAEAGALVAVTIALVAIAPAGRILVPFLAVIACAAVILLDDPATRPRARVLRFGLGAAAAVQLCVAAVYLASLAPLDIARGRVTDEQYLAAHRADNAAIAWCNGHLPGGGRALVLGTQELFAFDVRVRGGGNFDGPRVARYLEAPDLAAKLRDDGITHLVVFEDRLRAGAAPSSMREAQRSLFLSESAAANLKSLSGTAAVEIARQGRVVVYELKE